MRSTQIEAAAGRRSGTSHGQFGPVHRSAARKSSFDAARHLVDVSAPLTGGANVARAGYKVGTGAELILAGQPTAAEISAVLAPYVTRFGSDPAWSSRTLDTLPTPDDFPRRVATASNLTLDELSPAARVTVVGHRGRVRPGAQAVVLRHRARHGRLVLPVCAPGARPVPTAIARSRPSVTRGDDRLHAGRTDRTAQLSPTRSGYGIVVQGYAGRNVLGDVSRAKALLPEIAELDPGEPGPSSTMRAAVERRPAGVPGDLGWERIGPEVTLQAAASSTFHVTWSGTIEALAVPEGDDRRILITESETYPRDPMPGDPPYMFSPLDYARERIVYADTFEL